MTPEQLAAIAARNEAPWEIEKWLITIKAHCTVIADSGGLAKECADRIKQNIDDELRPALLAEVARLTAVIEHDRSKVVDVLAEANAVLKNYGWLADGRGSYAFDDDRWKDEFKVCMDSLAKVLDPMRGIASDLSDSPIKWADIVAARSMTDALAEAEQRGYDAAKEQAAKWHDDEADYNSGVLQAEESDSVCRGFFADALTFHRDSAKELRAMVRP